MNSSSHDRLPDIRPDHFLGPSTETLAELGDAVHQLYLLAGERRSLELGGASYQLTTADFEFGNGAHIHGIWVEGGGASSVSDLDPEFPVTYVNVDNGGERSRYTLCAGGKTLVSTFRSDAPRIPGGANLMPTESSVSELAKSIGDAVSSGLINEANQ